MPRQSTAKRRKVLVLTGASGRLGTAFCEAYAGEYEIAAVSRTRSPKVSSDRQSFVDPLFPAKALKANANPVFEVRADLSQPRDVARLVEVAMARYGRIDVLVNAAGLPGRGRLLGSGLANAESIFRLNALAPIELASSIADACWRKDAADNKAANRCVVSVSAAASVDVLDGGATASFGASKAALNVLTAHLAEELRPFHVRANVVAPVLFPGEIPLGDVVSAVHDMIEGDDTGRVLLLWGETSELV